MTEQKGQSPLTWQDAKTQVRTNFADWGRQLGQDLNDIGRDVKKLPGFSVKFLDGAWRGYVAGQAISTLYSYHDAVDRALRPPRRSLGGALTGITMSISQDVLMTIGTVAYLEGAEQDLPKYAACVFCAKLLSNGCAAVNKGVNSIRGWFDSARSGASEDVE